MENEKIDWKNENIYKKLSYISAEISKAGIKQSGDVDYKSKRTGEQTKYKYFDMKDFVPLCIRLGYEVGLVFIFDEDIEKNFASLTTVNCDKSDEKIVTKVKTATATGTDTNSLMQKIGGVRTFSRRYLLRDLLNLAETDPIELTNNTEDESDENELLQPVSEKTRNKLAQLLGNFDDIKEDSRVADIAEKDISKMNEGWARFAIKTLENILKEKDEEDVPYDNPTTTVVEVIKKPTPEQMTKLRSLCKKCRDKGLCFDVINELNKNVSNLTYKLCEDASGKMQEALGEN